MGLLLILEVDELGFESSIRPSSFSKEDKQKSVIIEALVWW